MGIFSRNKSYTFREDTYTPPAALNLSPMEGALFKWFAARGFADSTCELLNMNTNRFALRQEKFFVIHEDNYYHRLLIYGEKAPGQAKICEVEVSISSDCNYGKATKSILEKKLPRGRINDYQFSQAIAEFDNAVGKNKNNFSRTDLLKLAIDPGPLETFVASRF